MSGNLKTKDKNLEVHLFDDGMLEIESKIFKGMGIEVRRIDPSGGTVSNVVAPPGALYVISTYIPEPKAKSHPFEHVNIYVGKDGIMWQELLSRLSRSSCYRQDVEKIVRDNR